MRPLLPLAAALTLLAAAPAGAAYPGRNGAIAYAAAGGLYAIPPGGGAPRRLVAGTVTQAAWSADGRRLAFVRRGVLYTSAADGRSRRRRVTTVGRAPRAVMSWSPAGTRLIFTRAGAIWRVDRDGRGPRRLTPPSERAHDAAWSPNGRRIVYVSRGRLMIMWASTGERRPLLEGVAGEPSGAASPDWSPRTRRVLFCAAGALYVFAVADSGLRRLPLTGVPDPAAGAWSPDGRRIVFAVRSRGARAGLYVGRPDGSRARRVVAGAALHIPTWQPRRPPAP